MNQKKRIDHRILGLLILFIPTLLASCRGEATPASPTPQPEAVLTAAAETANARLTEQAQPAVTQTPAPTDTPSVTVATLTPTLPLTPIDNLTSTTAPTAASPGSDRAEYVADITVPDGTDFKAGEAFIKTWRLSNSGTSTWTTDYALAFLSGPQMSGPAAVLLTTSVPPGQTVDISVPLVAPQEIGAYRGFWGMRNPAGQTFETAVYVEIDVVSGSPGTPSTPGTPGPTNTPGPTDTPGASGSARVSEVSLAVDDESADACPHTFTFTASFELNRGSAVTYGLEAGSETSGFTFNLPSAETVTFDAGSHSVFYTLDITSAMSGWARFHVTAPNEVLSNQVSINLTCTP
jgi:hypothetical protein